MSAAELRFYLDEDVPHAAAAIGRELGMDVVAAAERGMNAVADGLHLAAAAAEGRVMVTYNRDDFLAETRDAFALGRPHAGVLVLTWKLPRQSAPIAHALARWAADHGPMQPYTVDFLSK